MALNFTDFFIFLSCWDFRWSASFEDFFAVLELSVSECFLFSPGCVVSFDFLLLQVFGNSSTVRKKNNSLHTREWSGDDMAGWQGYGN